MGQALVIVISIRLAKTLKLVHFPDLTASIPKKIFPIPVFYLLNLLTSLGATQHLTIPMFTVLRRLGIVMTLVLELVVLDIKPTSLVLVAVSQIVVGSVIAGYEDLAFSLLGYVLILIYDFFGACEGVYVKKKLDDSSSLGPIGVLYYSVFFSILPIVAINWVNGDMDLAFEYSQWHDAKFVLWFFATNFMGLFNFYSWIICTDYNSPLMSQVVSCLRSILVTYIGMFVGGDYVFSWINFVGLNISMFGGFYYSYATIKGTSSLDSKDKHEKAALLNDSNDITV